MDIDARIRRRRRRDASEQLIVDYGTLAPVAHLDEPTDRGPVLERLLDHLEPVFDGDLPGDAYVWGPMGSGKSAVTRALFEHLATIPRQREATIHTSTRAQEPTTPAFVSVDARHSASEFAFYRAVLDELVEDRVPDHGIGTDRLRERLSDRLSGPGNAVLLVDHVDEPETIDRRALGDLVAPFRDSLAWVCVGRADPSAGDWDSVEETVEFRSYKSQVLVDILMERASEALTRRSLDHDHARAIADWADGNAHDALAALFVAADAATAAGRGTISEADVARGTDDVPRPGVDLGRVLALPENRQAVLRELVALDADDRTSVSKATDAIAGAGRIELSSGTVKRFLYEMAESGVLARRERDRADGQGRPPSSLELRFPPTVFRRLYDLRS